MEISSELAAALRTLVGLSDAVRKSPSDRQAVRRAVEQAQVVADLAKREGLRDETPD